MPASENRLGWAIAIIFFLQHTDRGEDRPGMSGTEAWDWSLCAATQIEQEAASVWFGWLWVHSAAAVHNIRDRQSHANHRTTRQPQISRYGSRFGLDSLKLITVIRARQCPDKLL